MVVPEPRGGAGAPGRALAAGLGVAGAARALHVGDVRSVLRLQLGLGERL